MSQITETETERCAESAKADPGRTAAIVEFLRDVGEIFGAETVAEAIDEWIKEKTVLRMRRGAG